MPDTLDTRLVAFASSLREADAIRSDAAERAFATVARHRCVPRFRYGPDTITVPQDALPCGAILDLIYSHQSLLTSTGHNGQPPSSSSAPTLLARMLEALDLRPGLSVLEIGAGTGYTFRHGDGYLGEPCGGPYDRIIVTCGVVGLSPHWLGQFAPGGRIVAPIAHGGVHPVVVTTTTAPGTVQGNAALWADFMPAAGPLRPAELAGHDPADYIPATTVTRIPEASPARDMAAYHDLWFFLAARHPNITRAYTGDGTVDPTKGACALHIPPRGKAWVQTDGSITVAGQPTVAEELRTLTHAWSALDQPPLTQFTCTFPLAGGMDVALWAPRRWATSAMR